MSERGRLVRPFERSKNGKRPTAIQDLGNRGATTVFRFA